MLTVDSKSEEFIKVYYRCRKLKNNTDMNAFPVENDKYVCITKHNEL